ncbi:hypothetical protein ACEPPN_005717 [Leptodophora sp. 'Broadleaf-Isolate-01']
MWSGRAMDLIPRAAYERIQERWDKFVQEKTSLSRWTEVGLGAAPETQRRRSRTSKVTKPDIDAITLRQRVWVYTKTGRPILTIQAFCEEALIRWRHFANGDGSRPKDAFYLSFADAFHGVIQQDIRKFLMFVGEELCGEDTDYPRPVDRRSKHPTTVHGRRPAKRSRTSSSRALDVQLCRESQSGSNSLSTPILHSVQERVISVNSQQKRLLKDPRVLALISKVKSILNIHPRSHYAYLAPQIIQILENGMAAQTDVNPDYADFMALNADELDDWFKTGRGRKVILLRDYHWAVFERAPRVTSQSILPMQLENMKLLDQPQCLDLQDFGLEHSDKAPAVTKALVTDIVKRLQQPTIMPVNALNIRYSTSIAPSAVRQNGTALDEAIDFAEKKTRSDLAKKVAKAASIGKPVMNTIHSHAIDIAACKSFAILGQAGAFSPWHIDNIGVFTWLTLEPDSVEAYERHTREEVMQRCMRYNHFYWNADDESVLKLWAFISVNSVEEQLEAEAGFIENGEDWDPPARWIKIIALTAFDTFIMPPGTIHAPITVSDCLFRGGMFMQKRYLKDSIGTWEMCSANPAVTNEGRPRQSPVIVDFLQATVLEDPAGCGYDEFNAATFARTCEGIAGGVKEKMKCTCTTGCTATACTCHLNGQRCGPYCHGGRGCANPCGWRGKNSAP